MQQSLFGRIAMPDPHGATGTDALGGPNPSAGRIASLDVIRGFALLGILVMNIESFSGPLTVHDIPIGLPKPAFVGWHAGLDVAILAFKWMFFEGKMRTLFSMLFGAGVVLLSSRYDDQPAAGGGAGVYFRRNGWLLCFGILHGVFIWSGDILSQYAIVALTLMYPLRRMPAKTAIITGLIIGMVGGTFGVSRVVEARQVFATAAVLESAHRAVAERKPVSADERKALMEEAQEASRAQHRSVRSVQRARASYIDSLAPRAKGYLGYVTMLFSSGWIFEVIGSMLLGMGVFKAGFLTAQWSVRSYAITAVFGYAIALPMVIFGVVTASRYGFEPSQVVRWMFLPYELEVFSGAIANAAVLLLICKLRMFAPTTRALGKVGRMAFTNYILTSLICQLTFSWGPWKIYGSLEYYQQIPVVLCVWAINIGMSAVWLSHFRQGPLEWGWRYLTYGMTAPNRA